MHRYNLSRFPSPRGDKRREEPIHDGVGEVGVLRLWCIVAGIALVVLCSLVHPVPEPKAGQGAPPREVVEGGESIHTAPPRAEAIRLAQAGSENWKRVGERVVSEGDEPTRVLIRGNAVFVPVTLADGGNEIDVHLLLDTGAAVTLIHTDVAEKLHLDLARAKKVRGQVVGGALITARVVPIGRLTVGPHTKRDWNIAVVRHRGSGMKYDGLLGMDVLRGLKFRVDFKKQVIVWE